ncbi:PASTA domain-containing protein [Bifidobacterium sp. 82T24]|uniref:PASTA domain-containing protein n=1 Tax=Bifidobacterium pluvialisilvae TaxID=2834436 RepID=UPI001C58A0EE|nr:PASTA domain-containing protein [Bifidobacterium pluvialisilvae]MBW3088554.1 PASTA domain-containing protein [Bifidobacterium pluvialisilvae]
MLGGNGGGEGLGMFCDNCGAKINEGERFCGQCGQPVPAEGTSFPGADGAAGAASPTPVPSGPLSVPLPVGVPSDVPAATSSATSSVAATAAVPVNRRRRLIVVVAAVVAAVVVLVSGLFITHSAGMWGDRTLPAANELQSASKGEKLTANIVADKLKSRGITTKINKIYSGRDVGAFTGYDGVKAGDTIRPGQTVTINESMGPGVPKGTTGRKAADIVTLLKSMNVPVTFRRMPVTDTTKYPEGTVLATSPADGAPVASKTDGIQVGVAAKAGDDVSVGYDMVGMDKDQAKKKLESEGYVVFLQPVFSSKQYLGKVVDSSPAPGMSRIAGATVTLDYGVDASKKNEVLGDTLSDDRRTAMTNTLALAGKYCTDGGDCVTLKPDATDSKPYTLRLADQPASGGYSNSSGGFYSKVWDGLSLCAYSQDSSGCVPNPGGASDYMKDFLIEGDTGAMELFAGFGLPRCGSNAFVGDGPVTCRDGQIETISGSGSVDLSELKYEPREFFVVMPVGADLDALKKQGYFGQSSSYQPDSSRVYLIRRDNSRYSSMAAYDGMTANTNPFVPGPDMAKFQEAPNAKNVYYLVDGAFANVNWDSLQTMSVAPSKTAASGGDASDGGASGGDAKSGGAASKSAGGDSADAASKQAFATLAGNYTFAASGDGSVMDYMTVKSDGSFSGFQSTANANRPDLSNATAPRIHVGFSGRFESATKNADGSYTLQCKADSFTTEGDRSKLGFQHCDKFGAYPAGSAISVLGSQGENYRLIHGYADSDPLKYWTIVNQNGGENDYGVYERDPEAWGYRR